MSKKIVLFEMSVAITAIQTVSHIKKLNIGQVPFSIRFIPGVLEKAARNLFFHFGRMVTHVLGSCENYNSVRSPFFSVLSLPLSCFLNTPSFKQCITN